MKMIDEIYDIILNKLSKNLHVLLYTNWLPRQFLGDNTPITCLITTDYNNNLSIYGRADYNTVEWKYNQIIRDYNLITNSNLSKSAYILCFYDFDNQIIITYPSHSMVDITNNVLENILNYLYSLKWEN